MAYLSHHFHVLITVHIQPTPDLEPEDDRNNSKSTNHFIKYKIVVKFEDMLPTASNLAAAWVDIRRSLAH